jgi:hypothetical protein
VEGLSGWVHDDVLTGASALRVRRAARAPGWQPPDESNLKAQNVSLIDGFAKLLGPDQARSRPPTTERLNDDIIDITRAPR